MRTSLNGEWTVAADGREFVINIPCALQACAELGSKYPSEAMPNAYLGSAVFKRSFYINETEKIVTLTFCGIMPFGTVFVNGKRVGTAEYCQAAFTFDISDAVHIGENSVEVCVEEKNLDLIGGMRFDLVQWSGIFDDVFLEVCTTKIKEPEIIYNSENETASVAVSVSNIGVKAVLEIYDGEKCLEICEGYPENDRLVFDFSTAALEKWSPESPKLYTACIKTPGDTLEFKLGLRSFKPCGDRLLLNDIPFYAFGGGDEYFSPTISPLRDKEIIRQRYKKIKEMGFNFYRFHTHSPTAAELEVCDELGIMVSVEIPILSNFSRIADTEKGLEILAEYIKQTRTHPCIADYCLGNEGVQLLVKDKAEHETARAGYRVIKENTSYQLAMLCFGYQGEVPELDNDIMTPHLWSQEFRWAYQGLAKTPWSFIQGTLSEKPCIVHEFGKYGVWPSDREDKYYLDDGYHMSNVKYNDLLFENSGLEKERERIIKNSRSLSTLCAKTAFESMRRNSGISGYIYWTMFRMGIRAGGLCDDFGERSDCDAQSLRNSANAPLGLFFDRDFSGRTFTGGEQAEFNITVSNFSHKPVKNASLTVSLDDGECCRTETFVGIDCALGEISVKGSTELVMSGYPEMRELRLTAELSEEGTPISKNSMRLWCYPNKKINSSDRIVYHVHDAGLEKNLKSHINICVDLWSWISILTGCVIPEYGFIPSDDKIMDYIAAALNKLKPSLVICDRMDEVSDKLIAAGVPVLFIDSGAFDSTLYPEVIPGNSFFDLNRFYAPFRTSWDEGNSATLIDGELFDGCEDFADLRWYSCIEDSTALLRSRVIERLGLTDIENSVRLIQRVKDKVKVSKNSTVYFEKTQKKCINDCVYYIDGRSKGVRTAVASMNLFADACGRYTFGKIVDNLLREN